MTDRELLELAAKAAGIEAEWHINAEADFEAEGAGMFLKGARSPDNSKYWNPLTNDGDALRLMVDLELKLNRNTEHGFVYASAQYDWEPHEVERIHKNTDPYAATRRAIVRAAAELGKDMMTKVFVVLEEDRGCGVSVAGVFSTLEAAQSYLSGPCGSNCYLASIEGSSIDESVMG